MANIFDYLRWRGDLSFTQDPPNAVDALVFSALSYINYGCRVEADPKTPVLLQDAAEEFFAQSDQEARVRVKHDLELLRLAATSIRFGKTKICMFRNEFIPEQETQFAAMSFLLDDGSMFLAFRGTDYSLIGWKEDFNMTFQQTIPAQRLALQYTREVAMEYMLPMHLGGHSKGGNLAVFAAARSSPMIQELIRSVYSNDGPGFTQYLMGDPGYLAMVPRIKTYIPQSSVIGMLLEHEEPYTIIRSNQIGIMQHDPYSWMVLGANFIQVEELTADSRFLDRTFKNWLSQMSNEERSEFFDTVFDLLESTGAENAVEIIRPQNVRAYLKTLKSNEYMRNVLASELVRLVSAARQSQNVPQSDTGF